MKRVGVLAIAALWLTALAPLAGATQRAVLPELFAATW